MPNLFDNLKNKYLELLKPVGQTLGNVSNYFNPQASGTKGFWGTPVAQGMANAQKTIQNVPQQMIKSATTGQNPMMPLNPLTWTRPLPKVNIPNIPIKNPVGNFAVNNLVSPMAQSFLNTPYNIRQGSINTVKGIVNKNPNQALTGVGQFGEGALNLATLGGTGTVAKGITKLPFKTAVTEGLKGGAWVGGAYGLSGGLQGDDKSIASLLKSIGMGALIGGAIGGGVAAGTNLIGKVASLLNHKPNVIAEMQQRAAVQPRNPQTGEWMRNKLVKPKGMPQGAWEMQQAFNKKYNRNPGSSRSHIILIQPAD